MSKIFLSNVSDLTNSTTAQNTINSNAATVQSAFDNTLSRDGTFPNTMGANLDMNSNQILNLPAPVSSSSPARLVDIISNPTLVLTIPPVGTSGATVPLLNANNTWSGTNNLTGEVTVGVSNAGLAKFSIGYSQTPLTANRVLFQIDNDSNSANGHLLSAALGLSSPNQYVIPGPGALTNWLTEVDIGIDNTTTPVNVSTGHWFRHSVSKGTGAGGIGVLIQGFALAGYTPSGSASLPGVVGAQINGWSDVGGNTWGAVVGCITTASGLGNIGLEVDSDIRANTSGSQIGVQVVSQNGSGSGTPTVTGDNAGFVLLKSTGPGFKNAFQLGSQAGADFPLLTTGSVIKSFTSSTITNGIDISSLTITGSAFKSTGFSVDGSGNVTGLIYTGTSVTTTGAHTAFSGTAVPAGGTTGSGFKISSTTNLGVFFGSGVPTLSAAQGSLYIRTDGSSSSTRLYVNSTGSTTWVNITSAS